MTEVANQINIRALLVDDEHEANELLKSLIHNTGIAEVCGVMTDASDIERQITALKPDVIFLDIEMPGISGIEVLKKIQTVSFDVKVVFVTAFESYLLEALRLNAFDYLLKPVDRKELQETLLRIKPLITKNKQQNTLFYGKVKIPTNSGIELLDPSEILYLQAEGTYTHVMLRQNKVLFSSFNLGKIKKEHMPSTGFIQISRGIVVNVSYLKRVDRHNLEIILQNEKGDEVRLKYSRNYLQNLL